MSDTLIDRADSGEIPRLVGETRIRIDTGEATQRIDPRLVRASSFDAIPRRVIEIDDTVTFHIPETIGIVPDLADAQPVAPWERVVDTDRLSILGSLSATVDGELQGPLPRPGPLPPNPPPAPKPGYVGRHRDPLDRVAVLGEGAWGRPVEAAKPAGEPRGWRVFTGVSAFVVLAAAVTVVVLAVAW